MKKRAYLKPLLINRAVLLCLLGVAQMGYGQADLSPHRTESASITAQKFSSDSEIKTLRSAYSKHYHNRRGGITAVIETQSIHYEDSPGVWKKIDLNIQKSTTRGVVLENTSNTIRSFYPLLGDKSPGVQISTEKGEISFGSGLKVLHYNADGVAIVLEHAGKTTPVSKSNQVLYKNLFTNADMEYLIGTSQIKSNLILNNLPASLHGESGFFGFSETLGLPSGWQLETDMGIVNSKTQSKSEIRILNETGTLVYVIPVPDVFEKNNPSESIHPDGNWPIAYEIVKRGNMYEIITLVPLDWMSAADRNYPVVIDPTVVLPGTDGGWQDNIAFFEGNPSGFVFTGFYTGTDHRAYTKFNTASIPDNAFIQNVEVELYQNAGIDNNPETIIINDITGAPGPYGGVDAAAFLDFGNGPYTSFTATVVGTYGTFDLGISADTNLQNRLGADWFQIGLFNAGGYKRFTSDSNKLFVAYDTCIIATYSWVDVQCATDSNGTATVTIDSITAPPYTYLWNTSPSQTTSTATGLTVGAYQVTITDSAGCQTTKAFDVVQLFTSSILSSTDIVCNGDSTGAATVTVSGGIIPYTYQWDDPSSQTNATATNLSAGIYNVIVTDSSGCIDSSIVETFELAALFLTTSAVDNLCATASNGTASVIVFGGTPAYTYLWNDLSSQTTATATGLIAGFYSVVVTDNFGCTDSAVVAVGNPPPNDVGVISIDAPVSGCGLTSTESVTVTVVNFGANLQTAIPLMYQVNGGPIATEIITGNFLACDTFTYTFTATTDMSVLGIYFIDSWSNLSGDGNQFNDSTRFVQVVNQPVISALPYNENFESETVCSLVCGAACALSGPWINNTADDDIDWTVDVAGTSSISTGPTVDHTLGNNFGKYVYTEASGCINSKALIIGPCIDLSSAANPYLDFWYHMYGATMGKLMVDIFSGGAWNLGVDSLGGDQGDEWRYRDVDLGSFSGIIRVRFRGVTGGNFTSDMALDDIRVYDKPLEDVGVIRIDSPTSGCALDTNEVVTIQVQNFGVNVQDTLFLFYQINGGPIISESLVGTFLPGDTIQYTFSDSADLSIIGAYTFDAWANVTGDGDTFNDSIIGYNVSNMLNVSAFPYSENFESGQNGWISGGVNSSWAFGLPQKLVIDTASSGVNAWVTGGLGIGAYNNNESSYVLSPCFDFSSLTSPVIKMDIWWNSEFNQDGASLQSSINNGATWQDVGNFGDANNWFTGNGIIGLAPSGSQAGWTGRNLTTNGSVDWVQASRSLIDLAGEATVIFRMNFGSNGSITDDGFGFDDVEVSDAPHCLNGILDADEEGVDCGGVDCTPCYCISSYTDTIDEWISDVTFNTISNPSTSTSYSNFTNLSTTIIKGSTYTLSVETTVSGVWTEHIWAWIDWNQDLDFSDPGEAYDLDSVAGICLPCTPLTANITVPAGAVVGPTRMRVIMEFNIDPVPCGGATFGETEDYTVIIIDNCATLAGSGTDLLCFEDSSGTATVSTTLGNPPFAYLWDDPSAQTDSTATGLSAGNYQVVVSDSLGCIDSVTVTIGEPTLLVAAILDSGDVSCNGSADGFAVAGGSSGVGPYTYNWVPIGVANDSAMGLVGGNYVAVVTDFNNCSATANVEILEPDPLLLNTVATNETCLGSCDGAIETNVTGGTPGYTYNWSPSSTADAVFGLCPAVYNVTVTDANGCNSQATFFIIPGGIVPSADAGADQVICEGDSVQIGGSPTSLDTSALIFWTPNDSTINSPSASNPFVSPSSSQVYNVSIATGGTDFILTDVFDFGEDGLSHSYTDSGGVQPGAYFCNGGLDSTLRIGLCAGISGSYVEITAIVTPGSDSIRLDFIIPWTGTGGTNVYIDGLSQGTIDMPLIGGCTVVSLYAGGLSSVTNDGEIVIRLRDELNACSGDAQVAMVRVYSENMCTATDSVLVTVNPAVIVDAGSGAAICFGIDVTIGGSPSASGGTTPYTYTWTPSATLSNGGVSNPVASPTVTTAYELNVSDAAGCANTDTVIIVVPQNGNTWLQKANYGGTARIYGVGFSIGNKGYIGTGSDGVSKNDFWEYDPANDTWIQKADFGGTARQIAVGFSIGDKGYIGTGTDGTTRKDFWEYDATANTWTQKADVGGSVRMHATAFSINGKGYIGVGWNGGSNFQDFWEYDPATDVWTQKANFGGVARRNATGFSINDKGYIGTGYTNAGQKDFWEYDPTLDTWTQKTDFGGPPRSWAVGFSIGSKGYIGTGTWPSGAWKKDFWEYDPELDTWTQRTDFGGIARAYSFGIAIGSKGYIGLGSNGTPRQDVWEFTPDYSSYVSGTNVLCKGGNSGTADLLVMAGASPFIYLWSNGATTEDLSGLSAGSYSVIITDSTGCVLNDTIVVTEPALNLIVDAGIDDSICSGGSLAIGGSPSATGGIAPYTYSWNPTDSLSSDSIANPLSNPSTTTNYVVMVTDSIGCVRLDTMVLSIIPDVTTADTVSICLGDSILLAGAFQNTPGQYVDTLTSQSGCDSIHQTELLIISILNTMLQDTICDGDSIFLEGAFQFTTGTYVDSFIAVSGCDSLILTELIINPVSNTAATYFLCDNDSVMLGGSFQTSAGFYLDTLTSISGCDSIVTTEVILLPTYTTNINDTICAGDSVFLGGAFQNTAGTYLDTLVSVDGCDSVVTTDLVINPVYFVPLASAICAGDSILLGGAFQTVAGVYNDTLSTVDGCDSILATTLTVNTEYLVNLTDSICNGDSILLAGSYQTTAGAYSDSLLTIDGCDSIITTVLTVNPTYTTSVTAAICDNDSILLGGAFQNSAGLYVDTLTSIAGCDSIVSTTLSILPTYTQNNNDTICASDSVFLGGAFQNTAGIYTDTLSTVDGCDSVVITDLTVNPVFLVPLSSTICNGDSILLGGAFQTAAGVYNDSMVSINGCDSIISTTLTVNPSYFTNPSMSICDGDSAFIAGAWRSTAGSYADSALTSNGCDSVTTTALLIDPIYSINDTAFICDGDSIMLGGSFQLTAGSYSDTLNTVMGCDSIVVTFLIIGTPISLSASSFDALCDGACDGSALSTVSGGNGSFAYSWSTSPIQTNATANNLCAGTYLLTVTDSIGCQAIDSVSVAQPMPLIPVISGIGPPSCFGFCDAAISASIFGGTPPYTYVWNDPATQTNTTAVNLCADTFAITVVDSNGCSAIQSGVITAPAGVIVLVSGTDSLCTGACSGTATANVSGGVSPYTYAWSNGPSTTSISNLCIGTYIVTVEDSNGCSLSDSLTIASYPLESASFSYLGSSFCQNALAPTPTVSGNTGGIFTAPPNLVIDANTGQIQPNSSLPGTYDVVYTTAGPCPESDTVQVTILPLPNANIAFTAPICGQDTAVKTLSATPPGGIWSGSGITDSINGLFSPIAVGPGLHEVIYTVTVSGCSNTDTAVIAVIPIPSMSLSGTDTICAGGATIFQVSIAGIGPFTITYTDGANTFTDSNIYDGSTITFTPTTTTTYSLLGLTDSVGCNGITGGSMIITVIPAPPAPIVTTPIYHCEGDLMPQLSTTAQSGGVLTWYNDTLSTSIGTGSIYTPFMLNPGSNYFYVSELINGCSSAASEVEIVVFSQGNIDAGPDEEICLGDDVQLLATGGSAYQWYPSIGLNDTSLANPLANPETTTVYYVIATVNGSCYYEDSIRITVDNSPDCGWYIYSGFTPNGDGDNDTWIIDGIEGFPDNEVGIYNRWEDVVAEFTGYNNTSAVWNGENKSGQALPDGTYFYIIAAGGQKYTGWVHISR